jgi:hypothetical protein
LAGSSTISSSGSGNSSTRSKSSRQHTYRSFLLQVAPDANALLLAATTVLPQASPKELAMLIWGAGALKLRLKPAWAASFLRASYYQLPSFQLHEKAVVLQSLAKCRVRPPVPWLASFFGDGDSREVSGGPNGQEQSVEMGLLKARSSAGAGVGCMNSSVSQEGRGGGDAATVMGLGASAEGRKAGIGRRPVGGERGWGDLRGGSLPPQEVGMMLWACGAWRFRPSPSWVTAALEGMVPQLRCSSPWHVGMTLRGLGKLMYRPSQEVLGALMRHLKENMHAHRWAGGVWKEGC